MATLQAKEINDIHKKRHNLIREYDKKLISEIEYETQMIKLNNKLFDLNKNLTEGEVNNMVEETVVEETVVEETVVEEKPKKAKVKSTEPSYAKLIIETLMSGSCKTVDEVVDKVEALKPGRKKSSIKAQVGVMINEIIKQKPARYEKYSWDAENFKLTEK